MSNRDAQRLLRKLTRSVHVATAPRTYRDAIRSLVDLASPVADRD